MSERQGNFDKDCLYSTVKNTSGQKKKFGFLPPHGVELQINEEYTVFGNILEAVTRDERVTSRRMHQALAAAMDRGDLTIVNTPAPVLKNITNGTSKMLQVSGGGHTISAVDPCWATSDSLDVVTPA